MDNGMGLAPPTMDNGMGFASDDGQLMDNG